MHRFELYRHADPSGVSGTGTVAEGVEFTDGTVAYRWLTATPTLQFANTIVDVALIHGHHGATQIIWIDR
jgi:hypothetical protein